MDAALVGCCPSHAFCCFALIHFSLTHHIKWRKKCMIQLMAILLRYSTKSHVKRLWAARTNDGVIRAHANWVSNFVHNFSISCSMRIVATLRFL